MPIDEALFHRAFGKKKTIARLQNSSLPFKPGELPTADQHRAFIQSLFEEVKSHRYYPEAPRGYIVHNKYKGVARIVPVFTYRDLCVYYFCIKCLEDFIAVNRVEGTYGGWRLGNPIWRKEHEEQSARGLHQPNPNSQHYHYGAPYGDAGTYYPARWHQNWGDYQNLANSFSHDFEGEHYIHFDIANFYDTISLAVLETRVRSLAPVKEGPIVDLLFHFLRNWNRFNVGYASTNVGIPQDEKSDCSRILANLYLQSYDREIYALCNSANRQARYLRYTDDQIIMGRSRAEVRELLYHASIHLHKLGLNLNSGKVDEIEGRENFRFHWCFAIFEDLEDTNDSMRIARALEETTARLENERSQVQYPSWRKSSIFKRFITIGLDRLDHDSSLQLVEAILEPDFLQTLSAEQLGVLSKSLDEDRRVQFFQRVEILIPEVPHNSFQLAVLSGLSNHLSSAARQQLQRRALQPIGL
jgi:hypothetical protein